MEYDAVLIFDTIFSSVCIASLMLGALHGFVKEIITTIGWIISVYYSWIYSQKIGHFLLGWLLKDELILEAIGMLIICIIILFISSFLSTITSSLLAKHINNLGMKNVSMFCGAIIAIIKNIFFFMALVTIIANVIPEMKLHDLVSKSKFHLIIDCFMTGIQSLIPLVMRGAPTKL